MVYKFIFIIFLLISLQVFAEEESTEGNVTSATTAEQVRPQSCPVNHHCATGPGLFDETRPGFENLPASNNSNPNKDTKGNE